MQLYQSSLRFRLSHDASPSLSCILQSAMIGAHDSICPKHLAFSVDPLPSRHMSVSGLFPGEKLSIVHVIAFTRICCISRFINMQSGFRYMLRCPTLRSPSGILQWILWARHGPFPSGERDVPCTRAVRYGAAHELVHGPRIEMPTWSTSSAKSCRLLIWCFTILEARDVLHLH